MVDFITYPEISYLYDEFMMVRDTVSSPFFFFFLLSRLSSRARLGYVRTEVSGATILAIVDTAFLVLLHV